MQLGIAACTLLLSPPCFPQIIVTVAGNGKTSFSCDEAQAVNASFSPRGLTMDAAGNLYVSDWTDHADRICKISPRGIATTFAGNGNEGFSGDGGPATGASLNGPKALAVDAIGNLYIADVANDRIRKVDLHGIITTVVGNGRQGFSGDGGLATDASLSRPNGVAVDGAGNIYVADTLNHRIRKVNHQGTITTVAGNGVPGFSGDGSRATSASLNHPDSVVVDAHGNVFIADTRNSAVRKVNSDGNISTIAGNGAPGFSGDGGPATSASLDYPIGLALDASGNLYIADTGNSRIREIGTNGVITTVAGNGHAGFAGDGGRAVLASLHNPHGVAVDRLGALLIADSLNYRIRKTTPPNPTQTR